MGETTSLSRRQIAALTLAVGFVATVGGATASDDEATVRNLTEAHRNALFKEDPKALTDLSALELSYSHSDGHIEDRATMVSNATNGKIKWLNLSYDDITVRIVGDAAIVRFVFNGNIESDGKKINIKLGSLMVWQKQAGEWKLLARGATKL